MNKITVLSLVVMVTFPVFAALTFTGEFKPVQLPRPQVDGRKPLMQVLKDRSSSRMFSREKLTVESNAHRLLID